jgi:hypothetical protein
MHNGHPKVVILNQKGFTALAAKYAQRYGRRVLGDRGDER